VADQSAIVQSLGRIYLKKSNLLIVEYKYLKSSSEDLFDKMNNEKNIISNKYNLVKYIFSWYINICIY